MRQEVIAISIRPMSAMILLIIVMLSFAYLADCCYAVPVYYIGEDSTDIKNECDLSLAEKDYINLLAKQITNPDPKIRLIAVEKLSMERATLAINPLITALSDDDESIRNIAVSALTQYNTDKIRLLFCNMINDKNQSVRIAAINAHGQYRDERAVPFLIALFAGYPDDKTQIAAANALGLIQDPRAVEPLCRLLSANNERIQIAAIDALACIGDAIAYPSIVKLLKTNPSVDVLCHIYMSFAVFKEDSSITYLEKALQNENEKVRASSFRPLVRICGQKYQQIILNHINDPSPAIRVAAINALSLIDNLAVKEKLFSLLTDNDINIRIQVINILSKKMDDLVWNTLFTELLKSKDSLERITLIPILAKSKDARLIRYLHDLYSEATPHEKRMIIDQFNALHDSTAFDLLIKELDNDDLQIRTRAIKSLGEIGDKRVMDQLNDMYNTDNPLVFAAVEQALGTLNAEGILDKLMVNAKNVNPVIRYGAIAGLGERQENKAVEMLIDCMMNDRNLALRGYAMDLLSAKDNPLITQNIIRIIANNSAFTLRSKAIEYLSRMKDDQGYKILCSILPDENLQLRARAADALGVLGDQRAVPELLQAAKHEKNAWIRQRIIISIEKMSDTTAADALCALMTSEPSHFCRSSIAESLGLLKDRKAVPFLIKILDDSNKSVRISALHALTNISGINLGFDKNKWSEWFQGTKVLQK